MCLVLPIEARRWVLVSMWFIYVVCVQYCWSAGGHLAEIQSSYEEDLLDQLLPSGSLHWIGLTDLASEGGMAALE